MMKRILVSSLFVLCLYGLASSQTPRKAPALRLKDLRGRSFRLSAYRGKVLLVNFWATWCPPCRAEIPDLIKLKNEYRDRGLAVVGITYPPQTPAQVQRFVRKLKVNYPVALGSKTTKLRFTRSETLPMTFVIDKQGNLREIIEGILLPEEFDEKIKPLLTSGKTKT
jgi:thiol-disulfide isomerase/thioredoxin